MYSMTGYGRACVEWEGRQLTIELRAVNHRFLDLAFRMPRSFSFLEEEARKQIGGRLSRGHVDVFATYRNMRKDAKSVSVDEALLAAYAQALGEVQRLTGLRDARTLMDAASMPDVLVVTEAEEDREALRTLMTQALGEALEQLLAMRAREGAALQEDLAAKLGELDGINRQVEARYPQTVSEYRDRLRARVEELLAGDMDEQRLMQEVAIMADRSAINEETVRLTSHIAQMREALALNEPVGRKLDFIVQELNREVNTISSKSQDIPITNLVVAAKAVIEKMREQVQNVE